MFQSIMKTSWGYIALGIMAPLAEEVVFRGGVLRVLLNATGSKSHWIAIILSALSSLVSSTSTWRRASTPSCPGFGTRMDVLSHQSDFPGLMLHWMNNTVAYAMFHLMPQMSDGSSPTSSMEVSAWCMADYFFSLAYSSVHLQLALRMKKAWQRSFLFNNDKGASMSVRIIDAPESITYDLFQSQPLKLYCLLTSEHNVSRTWYTQFHAFEPQSFSTWNPQFPAMERRFPVYGTPGFQYMEHLSLVSGNPAETYVVTLFALISTGILASLWSSGLITELSKPFATSLHPFSWHHKVI